MLTKILLGMTPHSFDECIVPPGTQFVGAPYQLEGTRHWRQKIQYPKPEPLPTPTIIGVDLGGADSTVLANIQDNKIKSWRQL